MYKYDEIIKAASGRYRVERICYTPTLFKISLLIDDIENNNTTEAKNG